MYIFNIIYIYIIVLPTFPILVVAGGSSMRYGPTSPETLVETIPLDTSHITETITCQTMDEIEMVGANLVSTKGVPIAI